MKTFASDNYAPVLPEVMQALQDANREHATSYGQDDISRRTIGLMRDCFGADADVYFVFNGTGANVFSIAACIRSFQSVLCADTSHLYNDESSAPETFTGSRMFALPADGNGKLSPDIVRAALIRKGDMHYPQPGMLSLAQSTEYGTVYHPDELNGLSALCREHRLYLHIDGSRLFNALESTGESMSDMIAGVDILSLGATKIGAMYGEAVLVFNDELKPLLQYRHKQVMQLASKNRYIAAQFEALLKDDVWRKAAANANEKARYLAVCLAAVSEIKITRPVQANVVFAVIPPSWNEVLMRVAYFYVWREDINEVRLMCAWDTTFDDVDRLIAGIRQLQS